MKPGQKYRICFLGALISWGCLSNDQFVAFPDLAGTGGRQREDTVRASYQYYGYARHGSLLVVGTMTLMFSDSLEVNGTWDLRSVGGDPVPGIGPQVGTGKLVGSMQGKMITISLNPDYVDNNVFLSGTVSDTGITGTWEFVGFPGVMNRGTFRAVPWGKIRTFLDASPE